VEFVKYFFKRGLTSKEGKADCGVAGRQKESGFTHGGGCDRRLSRHGMRGRAEKENRERCVVVKEQGKERQGRGMMRRI
jgi:hypothetical protein